jgi:hypothetical protein
MMNLIPWYESADVVCVGFPRKILPFLAKALESGEVEWTEHEMCGFNASGTFKWLDCEWKIWEERSKVQTVCLISGIPYNEQLTMAVLRG